MVSKVNPIEISILEFCLNYLTFVFSKQFLGSARQSLIPGFYSHPSICPPTKPVMCSTNNFETKYFDTSSKPCSTFNFDIFVIIIFFLMNIYFLHSVFVCSQRTAILTLIPNLANFLTASKINLSAQSL